LWETEARADWSRFIYGWSTDDDDVGRNFEVISLDNSRVRDWLALWREAPPPWTAEAESEKWDVCEPFQATYWKTLPTGARVRFRENRIEARTSGMTCATAATAWAAWSDRYNRFSHWKRDLFAHR